MITLLFKYLLPLALFLAIFFVGYNYFFGTPEEQQQSQRIISKFTDLGGEVYDLLHTEKEKYDDGKYDEALAKISQRIEQLKQLAANAIENKQQLLDQVDQLDQARKSIQSQLNSTNQDSGSYGAASDGGQYGSGKEGSTQYGSGQYGSAQGNYQGGNVGSAQYGDSYNDGKDTAGDYNSRSSQDIGAQIEALAKQAEQVSSDFKKQVRK